MTGTVDISTAHALSPSYVNSFRILAVTSRLLFHLRDDKNIEITEFFNLCLSLARRISDLGGVGSHFPNLSMLTNMNLLILVDVAGY
ncbi:hypothetical protein L2E82_06367 [Cichorium intybus]|uniref:Uncharacterized protein n=1 Tax=Cichorium intybus TaxID=13427 RepID=A0ACB9H9U3_CICIN|nr:hypothetical protein L2E82_06367 [Cichorium intybus]